MSVKLVINGIPVEVSTPAEAVEILRAFGGGDTKVAAVPNANHPLNKPASRYAAPPGAVDAAVAFVSLIRAAGNNGTTTEKVQSALGADGPKGVGGRLAVINKLINHLGIRPEDVYTNHKGANGREWRARSKTEHALAALQNAASQNLF